MWQVASGKGANSETPADKSAAPPRRATRIPDDFEISDSMRLWASTKVPGLNLERSTEKFVNHFKAKAGRSATMLDWPASWRNWMLGDFERMPANSIPKPSTSDSRVAQADNALAALKARQERSA